MARREDGALPLGRAGHASPGKSQAQSEQKTEDKSHSCSPQAQSPHLCQKDLHLPCLLEHGTYRMRECQVKVSADESGLLVEPRGEALDWHLWAGFSGQLHAFFLI